MIAEPAGTGQEAGSTYAIDTEEAYDDEGVMIFVTSLLAVVLVCSAISLFSRAVGGSWMRQLSLFALRFTTVVYAAGMFLVAVMVLCIWLNILLSLLDFAAAPSTILELPRGVAGRNFWGFTSLCALASFSVVLARFICWAFVAAGGSFGVMYTVTPDLRILHDRFSDEFALLRCLHVSGKLDFRNKYLQVVFVALLLGASIAQVIEQGDPSAYMVLMLSGFPILLMTVSVLGELVMCTWNTVYKKHNNEVHGPTSMFNTLQATDHSPPPRNRQTIEEGGAGGTVRVTSWEASIYDGWTDKASAEGEAESDISDEPIQQIVKLHYATFAVNCLVAGFMATSQSAGLSDYIGTMLIRLLFACAWHFSIAVVGPRGLALLFVELDWYLIWDRWFNPPQHPAYTLRGDGSQPIRKLLANVFDVILFGFCLTVAPIIFCVMVYSTATRSTLGDFVIVCLLLMAILLCPIFLVMAHEGYLRATRSFYIVLGCCQLAADNHTTCCDGLTAVACCTRDPSKSPNLFPNTSKLDKALRNSFTKAFATSIALILFVVICFVVFWGPLARGYDSQKATSLKIKHVPSPVLKRPSYGPYKMCDSRWFEAQLDIYDLAMFANIAYADQESTDAFLEYGYPDWVHENAESHSRVRYQVFVHNVTNEHLITVRGTEMTADWFQNAQLWGQASIYQMTIGQVFAPPLVTVESVQRIVKATAFMEEAFGDGYHNVYWHPVLDEIHKLKELYPADKLLVVGHSLGGGVAKISGVKADIRSVAFNSPGLLYSARKLNLGTEDVNAYTVNIRSESDAISGIDLLGGEIQTIQCFDVTGDWLSCHSVMNQAAELQAACNFENKTMWAEYS